ncbi:MAG: hypothetical protein IJH78_06075 [Clostridia bacterium]|nr:hypothetical protein [Clostridia bacterium]
MTDSYIEAKQLRTCDCDAGAFWKPSSILEIMQETAAEHCDRLRASRARLEERGLCWVLSRTGVSMSRLPVYGERVTVETYLTPVKHLFYPRGNVIRDASGEVIGRANSYWLLMDLETRRMVNDEYVQSCLPASLQAEEAVRLNRPIRPLDGEVRRAELLPRFSELDLNGHVNNTRYMDWCCDALGREILTERHIMGFWVYYENELREDAHVDTELTVSDDQFAFFGFSEGRRCFSIGGTLGA